MSLMVSISGIRGIIGDTLTPEVIVKYTAAYAEYCGRGKIAIGRDGRITGKVIGNIVSSTLLSMGCNVIALGVVPTPTVALAVEKLGASGGISITASHNPIEWNGLKFFSSTGLFLDEDENKRFWEIANRENFKYVRWNKIGKHNPDEMFIDRHIDEVLKLLYIDTKKIKERRFKIVLDCINAAGGLIVPKMLKQLGCEIIEMNCDASGVFARTPEPIPENLTDVCERVKKEKADIGIVVDPDVDRLVFIDERGEPIGEEYTITSIIKFILEKQKALTTFTRQRRASNSPLTVVVNLSTTRAVDDVAKSFGASVVRTPVGEINVAGRMKKIGAIVGGEGSGGVILPAVHYGRDAIVGIGLILQQLAEFGGTVSEFKKTLPQYFITKSKIEVSGKDPDQLLNNLKVKYQSVGKINFDDGLKIDFPDSWVHLRKSNTEPIIRIIAEAPTKEKSEQLVKQFQEQLTQY
ncbi:MAG: phosphoglucosamine mutase [Ignavibacteriales bacterium]|nr:phosphoglucosamine mutase [Ignavibacteriales bacterium]